MAEDFLEDLPFCSLRTRGIYCFGEVPYWRASIENFRIRKYVFENFRYGILPCWRTTENFHIEELPQEKRTSWKAPYQRTSLLKTYKFRKKNVL